MLAALWEERRPNVMRRVQVVADAARTAARPDGLSREVQNEAREEAHRLVGSLGSFGFPTASDHARVCERELKSDHPDARTLRAAVERLEAELAGGLPAATSGPTDESS